MKQDLVLVFFVFEWWLGSQKWINAKSSIALFLLIVNLLWIFITKPLGKEN